MKQRYAPLLASICMIISAGCSNAPRLDTGARAPASTAPAYQINDVIDASADELNALFGAPALTRREGEGEFRRYSLSTCELIVVLAPGTDGLERVAHIDAAARQSGEENPSVEACLAAG